MIYTTMGLERILKKYVCITGCWDKLQLLGKWGFSEFCDKYCITADIP